MRPDWKTCWRVGVSVFALYLAVHYWPAATRLLAMGLRAAAPILMGCVMAYIINIPMSFYERHYFPGRTDGWTVKSRRPVCLVLALVSALAVVGIVVRIVAPELAQCVSLLLSRVPGTLDEISEMLAESRWITDMMGTTLDNVDWEQRINQVAGILLGGFGNMANVAAGVITSMVTTTFNVVIGLIFAIYVLLGKERLARQFKAVGRRCFPRDWLDKGGHVRQVFSGCFHDYIVGQCVEAVILGSLCAAGMVIFRFPYAAVVGATIGFTALIPVAGAYIGGAVGFLLILTESPVKAVLFVVYLVVLQQLEGNIIYPKVVGKSLGLPGMWVLTAVIIGGGMGGILGMVLGVPLMAGVYHLAREEVRRS